jgi:hypothetical protein
MCFLADWREFRLQLGLGRSLYANALLNLLVVGDLVGQQCVCALQFDDLRGNGSLVIFENLAPLERGGVTVLTQLGVALHFADWHAGGSHAVQKVQPGFISLGVTPVTVARAPNRPDESHALVVAERVRGHSAALSHVPNGESPVLHTITVQL